MEREGLAHQDDGGEGRENHWRLEEVREGGREGKGACERESE